jgi:hypothetical protein
MVQNQKIMSDFSWIVQLNKFIVKFNKNLKKNCEISNIHLFTDNFGLFMCTYVIYI